MHSELEKALQVGLDLQGALEIAALLSIWHDTKDMPNCEKAHEAADFLLRNWLLTEEQAKCLLTS